MEKVSVLIIGGGTAATNAARSAKKAGAARVVVVHEETLINTCVEEGCMPSKSILAGAHQGEDLNTVMTTRDTHIARLRKALTDGFEADELEIILGTVTFTGPHELTVTTSTGDIAFEAEAIIIASGSAPFVPPIPGLDPTHARILISDEVVSSKHTIKDVPKRVLTIGAGPIGLELSTFFHDMGSQVEVLQRGPLLSVFDGEFGAERLRASKDSSSFSIYCNANLTNAEPTDTGVVCTIDQDGDTRTETYDIVLVATGRRPRISELNISVTGVKLNERGGIIHNEQMKTTIDHIYVAGDVVGHHQILHYAAEMGKVAGYNAAGQKDMKSIDYQRHMLAVSFDQFPSALIGLTQSEAEAQGINVVTSSRHFNSIGLGILKRQEYGLWKLVVEAKTGRVLGAQILGPDSSGELIQLLVPVLSNQNTVCDILNMTWYHPTYAEILLSLARDIARSDKVICPGV